jgi:hypothetical protein
MFKHLALLAVAAAAGVRADGDKPPSSMTRAFPNGLHQTFDFDKGGLMSVPTRPYDIKQWNQGVGGPTQCYHLQGSPATDTAAQMLPKVCYDAAKNDKRCDVTNYEVFDITYDDCDDPWTVCRCKDSPMPTKNIAEQLG